MGVCFVKSKPTNPALLAAADGFVGEQVLTGLKINPLLPGALARKGLGCAPAGARKLLTWELAASLQTCPGDLPDHLPVPIHTFSQA